MSMQYVHRWSMVFVRFFGDTIETRNLGRLYFFFLLLSFFKPFILLFMFIVRKPTRDRFVGYVSIRERPFRSNRMHLSPEKVHSNWRRRNFYFFIIFSVIFIFNQLYIILFLLVILFLRLIILSYHGLFID